MNTVKSSWLVRIELYTIDSKVQARMIGPNIDYWYSKSKYSGMATWDTPDSAIEELTIAFPEVHIVYIG